MARVTSNLSDVLGDLRRLPDVADLDRPAPGGNRRLGDEAANVVASAIRERTVRGQSGPDGSPLASLKRSTRLRKARLGQPDTIGVATGEMMELEQVRGMVAISANEMSMEAGLDAETKAKISHFQQGDSAHNQPPREFYALDGQAEDDLTAMLREAADARLDSIGG